MSRGDFGYGSTSHRDESSRGASGGSFSPSGGTAVFSELLDQISGNISAVSNNATTLERCMRQIGSSSDSVQLRDRVHATEQSTNGIINKTASDLKRMASTCKQNRQQKLQYDNLRDKFKSAVERYHTLQMKVAAKVKSSEPLPTLQPKQKPNNLINWQDTVEDEADLLAQEERRQQMQQQAEIVDSEVAMLQEREDRIHQLESDILDINEIFRDLGTMVHEQGETIDTIEANVEDAYSNVESGHEELIKASRYQRKARKKMCLLIVILLIVAIIVGLVIYLSIKK